MSYHQTIYNLLRGYGLSEADTFGFKALADNNTALGNANVHYRIYYILFN